MLYRFKNGGQINDFYFASFRFWHNLKNNFSKGFFQLNLTHSKTAKINLHC